MVTRKTTAARKVAKKVTKPAISRRKAPAPVTKTVIEVVASGASSLAVVEVVPVEKQKLIRDSFTMPKAEYELIGEMKGRLLLLSKATKKSELLRAGVVLLSSLSNAELLAALARVPSLKTGRPKKVKDAAKGTKKKL